MVNRLFKFATAGFSSGSSHHLESPILMDSSLNTNMLQVIECGSLVLYTIRLRYLDKVHIRRW